MLDQVYSSVLAAFPALTVTKMLLVRCSTITLSCSSLTGPALHCFCLLPRENTRYSQILWSLSHQNSHTHTWRLLGGLGHSYKATNVSHLRSCYICWTICSSSFGNTLQQMGSYKPGINLGGTLKPAMLLGFPEKFRPKNPKSTDKNNRGTMTWRTRIR